MHKIIDRFFNCVIGVFFTGGEQISTAESILEKNYIFDCVLHRDPSIFGIEIRPTGLCGNGDDQFLGEPDIDGPIYCWSAYALSNDTGYHCVGDFKSRDDAIIYASRAAERFNLSLLGV